MEQFFGYKRSDGRVGIRNHVLIMSIMGLANPLVRRLSECMKSVIPVYTPNGRGQVGEDRELTERTLLGLAGHPNVAAVLLVSYEEKSALTYMKRLQACGKPIQLLTILENQGVINATGQGIRLLTDMIIEASLLQREPVPISELTVALECGSSDPTSGQLSNPALGEAADRIVDRGGRVIFSETVELLGTEKILASRAVNEDVGKQIIATIKHAFEKAEASGGDIKSVNPVPENIESGLQTLEHKSLGALMKTGSRAISGVLQYSEIPAAPGLYFMDTPFYSAESMTGMTAGGAQITLFSTGVGNNIANPISPAIKISANPKAKLLMSEHIDLDISDSELLRRGERIRSKLVFDEMLKVCSGKLTSAEVLGETDICISRIGPSV